MKLFILFFAFVFTFFSVKAQTHETYKDSISVEIKKSSSDSLRAQRFYKESLYALQRLNDLELSKQFVDSSMHYSKISGFKDKEANCHFMYGLLERVSGNYDKALDHLAKNIKYFEKDSTSKAYALFQVGIIHSKLGDYENSLKTYFEILDIFEHKKDSFAMASTYNSIANIYGEMDRHDEAILNYQMANSIFILKHKKRNQSMSLRNIAEITLRKKDTLKSREYAIKSLAIAQEVNEDSEIGNSYYMLGRTYLSSDPKLALNYYLKAKPLLEKVGYSYSLTAFYHDLGNFYEENNKTTEALIYYNKGLDLVENSNDLHHAKNIYSGLSNSYFKNQNYRKAFDFQSKFITAKDSILNEENIKSINLLQKQFETEKKNKEIVEQQLELKQQDDEIQQKNNQLIYMSGIALFLLVASLLTWLVFQQKQKRKSQELLTLKREYQIKSLESLIEGEEKERLRIAKELHDGVNGDLSAIKYKLSTLLEMNNKVIKEAITMIDSSCEQVRAISHNLVPPSLENFNLIEASEEYCFNLNEMHTQEIVFQHLGDSFSISKSPEINVFRIIQELVSNSIKHAEADEINVQISCRENHLSLSVEDNGIGFDPKTVKSNGIGLKNIQSRVDYLQATMDVLSNEDGTSYTIEMDINKLNDHN
ncbi:tetratricopeptide repeat protein [Psychroserpens jangbogonensis]|uniref:tetratricopeptide repeat protein n=1 Tax=Psychroserpens jangbogonensis TaxID=1484460 RepID=UPI00053E62F5|nr:tetratricopeptide repeat protein [Psychroserpens jangbogonensis]